MATSDTGYTVVAIPANYDKIWDVSSEKVPHLTLLFLGDHLENLNQVETFIEHAVNTTLNRFTLFVDRRGILGDRSADVLFFSADYGTQLLQDFRHHLLSNDNINTAYNSVDQYPKWLPHLTLGYPNTPAKIDTRDFPHSVTFDRIALWTGDYEGVEFPLKDYNSEPALRMSEIGKNFLEHYGVKGMKWGVHRSDIARAGILGAEASAANRVKKSQTHDILRRVREAGGVRNINDKDLEVMLRRMDMESRYSRLATQHKKELTKGRTATLKFIGQVGKIALPILLGGALKKAATSPAAYRTYATVARAAIGK